MSRRWFGAHSAVVFAAWAAAPAVVADAADLMSPAPQYDLTAPAPAAPVIAPEPRYGILFPAFYATPDREANGFEARAGGFAHSIGGREARHGVDANVELLGPRLLNVPVEYSYFIPRPQVGVMFNSAGQTSYAYAGFAWTLNLTKQIWFEPLFGGAVHTGPIDGLDPTRDSLGCRYLFHTGATVGYRVDDHWSVMATWEHISNANLCAHNQGMNDYGLKLGYRF
jgi:lipid A 3-O-deacylase